MFRLLPFFFAISLREVLVAVVELPVLTKIAVVVRIKDARPRETSANFSATFFARARHSVAARHLCDEQPERLVVLYGEGRDVVHAVDFRVTLKGVGRSRHKLHSVVENGDVHRNVRRHGVAFVVPTHQKITHVVTKACLPFVSHLPSSFPFRSKY